MAEKSLKTKAASSMIWTAIQRYSKMIIQFISGIILARLLTAYDYGCIGMLTIFMVLAEAFIDGGFGSALIQKKNPTQVDYSSIFFWNLGMAVIMYAVLFFCAPAISRFYDIPVLKDVLRVQGLILFIYAFNIIQRNQLKKNLNFKIIAIVSIVTSVVSLLVTVLMAYHGFGVWSLVVQNMLIAGIPAIVFWFVIKWRPIWTFSWASFRELFSFGFYMFLTHLINRFGQQIQGLLIGKVYNPSTMGYYSKANGVERLVSNSISQVMTQVTYPLYASVQDQRERMINMIKRLTMTLSYFTFPIMFIMILLAKPMFIFLYSDRWVASIPYFQVLCIAGLPNCLQSVNLQTISAIGKSRTMFYWTVLKRVVGIGSIVLGLMLFGMKGLLAGVIINSWFAYFVNISLVSKHIGYRWTTQLKDLLPVTLASAAVAAVCYGAGSILHLGMYADGAVKGLLYVILYVGWSVVFKPEAYTYSLSVIPKKFRFWERKKKKHENSAD